MLESEFFAQAAVFIQVVLIDIVLAGDNAVVVGLAAAGLPPTQQRKVIFYGVSIAFVTRILFALVAIQLLAIVGLLLAGGILLLWVAWKMYRDLHPAKAKVEADSATAQDAKPPAKKTFRSAVIQVAIADISMSLDNVLAVAGAARDHFAVLVFGLLLSIALMGLAAGYIARLMERHRWIAYVGLVVVTFVALKMIYEGAFEVYDVVDGEEPAIEAPIDADS